MADKSTRPASGSLEPSEIDRLIAPAKGIPARPGGVVTASGLAPGSPRVQAYDFRRPALLSEAELRRLRMLHEDFARYLSARLSLCLRMDFGVKLARFATATYSAFTDALSNPTHLSVFKVEPLAGVGVLDIKPRLALTIADRLLGGKGKAVKGDRHLTEIETALIEDVGLILLEEWCGQWKPEQELRPSIIGHENNGRFLQTSPRDALMLAMTLECTVGDSAEQIQIGVPYHTIEPVVKKMQVRRQQASTVTPQLKHSEWQAAYDQISVPVRAEWDAFELSLREVCSLRVGDVLEMQATLCAETRVLLNGTARFVGTVGLDTDHVAVQLTRKLPLEESSHAKTDGRKVP
jgi:flagellar motor switch protein FliM